MDIMEVLTDDHMQELSEHALVKMKKAIDEVDIGEIKGAFKAAVINDISACLESNYVADNILWEDIGAEVSQIMLGVIRQNLPSAPGKAE
jgi:hypothetical protein